MFAATCEILIGSQAAEFKRAQPQLADASLDWLGV